MPDNRRDQIDYSKPFIVFDKGLYTCEGTVDYLKHTYQLHLGENNPYKILMSNIQPQRMKHTFGDDFMKYFQIVSNVEQLIELHKTRKREELVNLPPIINIQSDLTMNYDDDIDDISDFSEGVDNTKKVVDNARHKNHDDEADYWDAKIRKHSGEEDLVYDKTFVYSSSKGFFVVLEKNADGSYQKNTHDSFDKIIVSKHVAKRGRTAMGDEEALARKWKKFFALSNQYVTKPANRDAILKAASTPPSETPPPGVSLFLCDQQGFEEFSVLKWVANELEKKMGKKTTDKWEIDDTSISDLKNALNKCADDLSTKTDDTAMVALIRAQINKMKVQLEDRSCIDAIKNGEYRNPLHGLAKIHIEEIKVDFQERRSQKVQSQRGPVCDVVATQSQQQAARRVERSVSRTQKASV